MAINGRLPQASRVGQRSNIKPGDDGVAVDRLLALRVFLRIPDRVEPGHEERLGASPLLRLGPDLGGFQVRQGPEVLRVLVRSLLSEDEVRLLRLVLERLPLVKA